MECIMEIGFSAVIPPNQCLIAHNNRPETSSTSLRTNIVMVSEAEPPASMTRLSISQTSAMPRKIFKQQRRFRTKKSSTESQAGMSKSGNRHRRLLAINANIAIISE